MKGTASNASGPSTPAPDHVPFASSSRPITGLIAVCHTTACAPSDRHVYLYHVVDNEQTWKTDGAQAVVWQTAINPVIGLELLANGTWSGAGVLGPEAFDAVPFMDLLNDHGSPWGMTEMTASAGSR